MVTQVAVLNSVFNHSIICSGRGLIADKCSMLSPVHRPHALNPSLLDAATARLALQSSLLTTPATNRLRSFVAGASPVGGWVADRAVCLSQGLPRWRVYDVFYSRSHTQVRAAHWKKAVKSVIKREDVSAQRVAPSSAGPHGTDRPTEARLTRDGESRSQRSLQPSPAHWLYCSSTIILARHNATIAMGWPRALGVAHSPRGDIA